jgi:myo-inositol 2-dehydrogenase/D-chiro-inositol 1-dehydrogenase
MFREDKMSQNEVTRRGFITGTAGVAFGAMVVPRRVLGGAGYLPPSETVNVAIVGCGGQGAADAGEILAWIPIEGKLPIISAP